MLLKSFQASLVSVILMNNSYNADLTLVVKENVYFTPEFIP